MADNNSRAEDATSITSVWRRASLAPAVETFGTFAAQSPDIEEGLASPREGEKDQERGIERLPKPLTLGALLLKPEKKQIQR